MKVQNSSINKESQKRIGHWQTFGSKSAQTNTPTRNAITLEMAKGNMLWTFKADIWLSNQTGTKPVCDN